VSGVPTPEVPAGPGAASTTALTDGGLEDQIGQWRAYVRNHAAISSADADELEHHLRDQVADLGAAGLSADEAFLVAVRRMGRMDEISREFAREHSERLWKQLVLSGDTGSGSGRSGGRRELAVAVGLAVAAAVCVKLPALFGLSMTDSAAFYALNLSLFAWPFLAALLAWRRRMRPAVALARLAPPFLAGAVVANVYPFAESGSTIVLAAVHLPVALWFAVGLAYVGGDWRDHARRMDFIRFTGEWVVYFTLLALGGAVLVGLTVAGFGALDLDPEALISEWVLPCGAVGAVVIAGWLVEAKQDVVENIAPVLTAVFTPLTTLLLAGYLALMVAGGNPLDLDRDLLILADVILVLVLGLVLYAVSARDQHSPPGAFDRLQLLLVALALVIDGFVLAAMLGRIGEFGTSPNRVAALGLNVVLLVNLVWSARLQVRFVRGGRLAPVARWQTTYLPVFAVWASLVAVLLPIAFGWG
jgi:hypothetical protein